MAGGKKRRPDDLLQSLPREKTGHRFFKHDVFLSHNQNDGSHLLRDALEKLGVAAWHDGYADMTQRDVQQRVWGALTDSRYICLCVADGFRDSEWVQVEYKSGLDIERRFGIRRVVVALTGQSGQVPELLTAHRRFDVHNDGVSELADFLLRNNSTRTPAGPIRVGDHDEGDVRRMGQSLRGVINRHTTLHLTPLEKTRLGRERVEVLLAQPPSDDLRYLLGSLVRDCELTRENYPRSPFGHGQPELEAVFMDIFEALSRHPEHVLYLDGRGDLWFRGLRTHGVLDPLGQLITRTEHRERASRAFEGICAALELPANPSASSRGDVPCYRQFAAELRQSTNFPQARDRLTTRLSKNSRRPWWKFW